MNGRDFLPTARRLAGGRDEADWRSAASRAYYAARDLLTAFHFTTPRADHAHEYLYRRLNNCGERAVQDAADQLLDLRRLRNRADYDMRSPFLVSHATDAVADADQILQTFDALTLAERSRITDAIKDYERQIGDVTWRP